MWNFEITETFCRHAGKDKAGTKMGEASLQLPGYLEAMQRPSSEGNIVATLCRIQNLSKRAFDGAGKDKGGTKMGEASLQVPGYLEAMKRPWTEENIVARLCGIQKLAKRAFGGASKNKVALKW